MEKLPICISGDVLLPLLNFIMTTVQELLSKIYKASLPPPQPEKHLNSEEEADAHLKAVREQMRKNYRPPWKGMGILSKSTVLAGAERKCWPSKISS
jgi:hypothetical protein